MHYVRMRCAAAILVGVLATSTRANWMDFTGGPNVAVGTWPAGSGLSGTATVTASNFVNGNTSTPAIGLTPNTVGPPMASDFFAAGLQSNAGGTVPVISTPYNDAGDRYQVVVDFLGTAAGCCRRGHCSRWSIWTSRRITAGSPRPMHRTCRLRRRGSPGRSATSTGRTR